MERYECALCGRDSAVLVKRPFDAVYNQTHIRLESVEMYDCDRCGEATFSAEQDKLVSDLVKRKVREKLGVLNPEEILGIRKRCNLTQEEMEQLFGLGQKVVIRWEKGRVMQSKTADVLLRLLDRSPAIIDELRQIQGQREISAAP